MAESLEQEWKLTKKWKSKVEIWYLKADDEPVGLTLFQVLVPATYATFPIHGKTCKEAMKAFANHAFDDFRELDEESKVIWK